MLAAKIIIASMLAVLALLVALQAAHDATLGGLLTAIAIDIIIAAVVVAIWQAEYDDVEL